MASGALAGVLKKAESTIVLCNCETEVTAADSTFETGFDTMTTRAMSQCSQRSQATYAWQKAFSSALMPLSDYFFGWLHVDRSVCRRYRTAEGQKWFAAPSTLQLTTCLRSEQR